MENAPLVGTWSLCSWYNQTEDGRRLFPFGKDLRLSAAGALLGGLQSHCLPRLATRHGVTTLGQVARGAQNDTETMHATNRP